MIYFAKEENTGNIKIGYTDVDPEERMAGLQTGNPRKIKLILSINGDQKKESEIHSKFKADNISGEWFRPSIKLKKYITRLKKTECMCFSEKKESIDLMETIKEAERDYLIWAIETTSNIKEAASKLCLTYRQMRHRCDIHKLTKNVTV